MDPSDSDRDAALIEKVQEELRERAAGELAPPRRLRASRSAERLLFHTGKVIDLATRYWCCPTAAMA